MAFKYTYDEGCRLSFEAERLLEEIDNFEYDRLWPYKSLGELHNELSVMVWKDEVVGFYDEDKEEPCIRCYGYYERDYDGESVIVLNAVMDDPREIAMNYVWNMVCAYFDRDRKVFESEIEFMYGQIAEFGMLKFMEKFKSSNDTYAKMLDYCVQRIEHLRDNGSAFYCGFGLELYDCYYDIDWDVLMWKIFPFPGNALGTYDSYMDDVKSDLRGDWHKDEYRSQRLAFNMLLLLKQDKNVKLTDLPTIEDGMNRYNLLLRFEVQSANVKDIVVGERVIYDLESGEWITETSRVALSHSGEPNVVFDSINPGYEKREHFYFKVANVNVDSIEIDCYTVIGMYIPSLDIDIASTFVNIPLSCFEIKFEHRNPSLEINVPQSHRFFCFDKENNVLLHKVFKTLVKGYDNSTIPNGILEIGTKAFESCKSLREIAIPESVDFLDDRAFCDCNSLKTIVFRGLIKGVAYSAFDGSDNIEDVFIQKGTLELYKRLLPERLHGLLKEKEIIDEKTHFAFEYTYEEGCCRFSAETEQLLEEIDNFEYDRLKPYKCLGELHKELSVLVWPAEVVGFHDDEKEEPCLRYYGFYERDYDGESVIVLNSFLDDPREIAMHYVWYMMGAYFDRDRRGPESELVFMESQIAEFGMLKFMEKFVSTNDAFADMLDYCIKRLIYLRDKESMFFYGFGLELYSNFHDIDWDLLMRDSRPFSNYVNDLYRSCKINIFRELHHKWTSGLYIRQYIAQNMLNLLKQFWDASLTNLPTIKENDSKYSLLLKLRGLICYHSGLVTGDRLLYDVGTREWISDKKSKVHVRLDDLNCVSDLYDVMYIASNIIYCVVVDAEDDCHLDIDCYSLHGWPIDIMKFNKYCSEVNVQLSCQRLIPECHLERDQINLPQNNRYIYYDKDNNVFVGKVGSVLIMGYDDSDIPNGIKKIGQFAFDGCRLLAGVCLPETVTSIEKYAFRNCESIKQIIIPDSVETIGEDAFYGCKSLRKLTLSNSVETIEKGAFAWCTKLRGIKLPDSLERIEDNAFYGCTALRSIEIPPCVHEIGHRAFSHCTKVKSIVVHPDNVFYDSRKDCNAIIRTSDDRLIVGCENTRIPDGIKHIEEYAFYACKNLKHISIPYTVESIGEGAFWSCTSLETVWFFGAVKEVGKKAFYSTVNIKKICVQYGTLKHYKKVLPKRLHGILHEQFLVPDYD